MASAGDEERSGGGQQGQGQGAPRRHHHHHGHIHVPNVNLQPGQQLMFQMVPPQVSQVLYMGE